MRGTVKHLVLLVLLVLLILLFAIPALRRMEPHRDIVPPPATEDETRVRDEREGTPSEWRALQSWGGIGAMTTQPFTITSHTWRIIWETEVLKQLGAGTFQIMVHQDGTLKSIAASTTQTDKGVTVLPGPGAFTLAIDTLQKWKVRVEEKG